MSLFSISHHSWERRREYVRLVKEVRLKECLPHIQAIRTGLVSVIPARYLSLLTWKVCVTATNTTNFLRSVLRFSVVIVLIAQELELEVCGNPEIDIELLKVLTFEIYI